MIIIFRILYLLTIGSFSINSNYDICNLDLIYSKESGYTYSLPRPILESFLSGKAFDNPEPYSEHELAQIRADINRLYWSMIDLHPVREKWAVISAGSPGSGKTTQLKILLEAEKPHRYVYVCPDDVSLKDLTEYRQEIAEGDGSVQARLKAYNKWRPASNASAHILLANLIREQYAFYFGTTCSSPQTGRFFEFLIKQGYHTRVIHLSANDDVRWESIVERDKIFVQSTEQDIRDKGVLVPQRISDTFLKYADEIEFYYRYAVKEDARLTAKWVRNPMPSPYLGTLFILDRDAYDQLKAVHNEAIGRVNQPDLFWEHAVESRSLLIE